MKTGTRNEATDNSKRIDVFGVAFCAMLYALSSFAEAQQAKKLARIGILSWLSGPTPPLVAFKEGLHELGWVEGKNVEFEYRYAEGRLDQLSTFANELVRLKVDIVVAGPDNAPTHAAKTVTRTMPIVMVGVVDPVSDGLVASLPRPGGNVTGLTWEVTREQAGKNIELLKESVPKISHVAILRNPNVSSQISYSKEAERAAKVLGLTIHFAEIQVQSESGVKDALGTVVNNRTNALLVTPYTFLVVHRRQVIDFAARHKLPAIYFASVFANDGGLMSYAPSGQTLWRRAAVYVDKILRGAKPADLPVERPIKFELVINLKTAKEIGLTITPNVLARADKVIR